MKIDRREYNNLKLNIKNKKELNKILKSLDRGLDIVQVLFLDLDNTLAANITCQNIKFYKGLYLNKKPIPQVIEAIEEVYLNHGLGLKEVVIISKALGGNAGRQEKLRWIEKYLSLPKGTKCIFLDSNEPSTKKAQIIKEFCKKNHYRINEALIIDDNKQVLQACEKVGIKVKYPQQVLAEYAEAYL